MWIIACFTLKEISTWTCREPDVQKFGLFNISGIIQEYVFSLYSVPCVSENIF